MIYFFLGLIIVLFAIIDAIETSKLSSALYGLVIFLFIVFLAGLRDRVGTDWIAYHNAYIYNDWDVEFGYQFFNSLFSRLKIPYNFFLLFLNFLSLSLYYFGLKRYAYLFVISILIFYSDYFMYYNLSGIRQAVAISFIVFGVKYVVERKFFKFLFILLCACSFHITSFIFLIAYFIPFRKINKKEAFVAIAFFFSLSFLIFAILELLSGDLARKAMFYLEWQENAPNLKQLFIIGALKRAIILIMVWIFGKKLWDNKIAFFFLNLYLFGYGIYLSTYLLSPDMGVRFSSYFIIFEIFLAGQLLYVNKKLTTRLIIASIFCIVSLYKIYTYSILDTYQYHFIFSN